MKKYIYSAFVAVLAMMVSCSDDFEPTTLDEIQVSSSYVAIPMTGGSTTIEVTTKDAYEITGAPEWLTINPTSGAAGTTKVTFSAESTLDGRTAEGIIIKSAGKEQIINVIQGLATVSEATCAEVAAGPDAKTYRTKGVVTAIANTVYGNFYINDGTGEIYVYGTLYDGKEKNDPIVNNKIAVGDEVTVEGPKTTYNGTVELVNVTVVKVNKSLLKVDTVDPEDATLPVEGGDFTVALDNKAGAVSVEVPENAQSWLGIKSINGNTITFHAAANEGGDRATTLVFKASADGKTYTTEQALTQKGAIVAINVADFNAAEVGSTVYRITAVVSSIVSAEKGRFYIKDYSGETYVYNCTELAEKNVKVGDIITITGKRDQYKETIEMTSATIEEVNAVEEISLADFNNLPDDKTKYYMISGIVGPCSMEGTKYDLETYGNFGLTDGNGGEVYVYGCKRGYGDTDKKFAELHVYEGDVLTMIAYKTSYKGTNEAVGFYFSHDALDKDK